MSGFPNLVKALALEDPTAELSRLSPAFYSRYSGEADQLDFSIEAFARYLPFFRFFYEDYFRVKVRGLENVPTEGRALLVGNHSGILAIDAIMMSVAMCFSHSSPRRIRYLVHDWFANFPPLWSWLEQCGQVAATFNNAVALLTQEELVGIYPEGQQAMLKTIWERYRLKEFDPGFVRLAIHTQSPIVTVVTVGGDEIFPNFANLDGLARFLHMPGFPVTLTFPWLPFPLMFMPLPVPWLIQVGKPIMLGYPPEKSFDNALVTKITREIRHDIQRQLDELLRDRKSIFSGWADDQAAP